MCCIQCCKQEITGLHLDWVRLKHLINITSNDVSCQAMGKESLVCRIHPWHCSSPQEYSMASKKLQIQFWLLCHQPMDKNMIYNAGSNLVRNYHSSLSFTSSSSSLPPPSHLDSLSSLGLIGIHLQAATLKNLVALPIGLYWWCQLIWHEVKSILTHCA